MSCLNGIIFTKKSNYALYEFYDSFSRITLSSFSLVVWISNIFFCQIEAIKEPSSQSQSLSQTNIYVQISNRIPRRVFFVTMNFECEGLWCSSHASHMFVCYGLIKSHNLLCCQLARWFSCTHEYHKNSYQFSYLLDRAARTYTV